MTQVFNAIATVDRRPFFEKALAYGLQQGIIGQPRLASLLADGPKGMVQIANYFGTAHLRTDLENARERMVNLVSLYLEQISGQDLQLAALSLRDKSFLAHSKGGSDLLKMLHALPDSTLIGGYGVSPDDQKNFLNDATLAAPLSFAEYRKEQAIRQGYQRQLQLASWLARKLGLSQDQLQSVLADSVIRTALLVLFVKEAKLELPGRTGLAKLLEAARKKRAKFDPARLEAFLANAPADFAATMRDEMARFVREVIPALQASSLSVDALLHDETDGGYFVNEDLVEELGEYDRLVAKEWTRITKGEGDDPSVMATIFFFLATGLPASAQALQREAKDVIQRFRNAGFNSVAVLEFIEAHAPHEMRAELRHFWLDDLMPEAEIHLADIDPEMPDSHMERALRYYQKTANAAWKGRGRGY